MERWVYVANAIFISEGDLKINIIPPDFVTELGEYDSVSPVFYAENEDEKNRPKIPVGHVILHNGREDTMAFISLGTQVELKPGDVVHTLFYIQGDRLDTSHWPKKGK